jgi:hypothetical protein
LGTDLRLLQDCLSEEMNSHLAYLNTMAVATLPHWWEKIDNDPKWQQYSFVGLAVAYGLIALVALVQLVRIQQRVPEYGWTTQKVFHLLNAFVCILRCAVFALRSKVGSSPPLPFLILQTLLSQKLVIPGRWRCGYLCHKAARTSYFVIRHAVVEESSFY